MKNKSYDKKNSEPVAITPVEYGGLQKAWDFFNRELFSSELPDCFLTYQRRANSRGFFAANRFSARGGEFDRHEVALNPDAFIGRTDKEVCSTLAHEQCHVSRFMIKGKQTGYHDKAWGALMKSIGLYPSATGKPGTGDGYWPSHRRPRAQEAQGGQMHVCNIDFPKNYKSPGFHRFGGATGDMDGREKRIEEGEPLPRRGRAPLGGDASGNESTRRRSIF